MSEHASTETHNAIGAANAEFMALFSRGDVAGLAAAYTEGGQVLPPNTDVVTDKQAVEAFWQGVMNTGIKGLQLETIEVGEHGASDPEVGKLTLRDADGQVVDAGKYVVIWKQEGGQWKLHRDIFNSSRATPGQSQRPIPGMAAFPVSDTKISATEAPSQSPRRTRQRLPGAGTDGPPSRRPCSAVASQHAGQCPRASTRRRAS